MDSLVQLVKVLIWPSLTLILALIFRRDIRALISRMSRLKYKDFEFTLGLAEAEAKVVAINEVTSPRLELGIRDENLERLRRIAKESPRAAIIEAYKMVETAAAESGFIQGADKPRINAPLYIDWLVKTNKLPAEDRELVIMLRNLRDQAVHTALTTPEIVVTENDVDRYLQLAAQVSRIILGPNE
jgi:hypothetical protein